jgi:uncharacterized membrane protein
MKRLLSVLMSLAYPVLILILLRHLSKFIPQYASTTLKLYPVAVNGVLFITFFRSLFGEMSFIEKMARLRRPNLDPQAVAYTRSVTKVWCGFFIVNGSICLALALWASTNDWFLYTAFISYILMALLFGGEWLVRRKLQHAKS